MKKYNTDDYDYDFNLDRQSIYNGIVDHDYLTDSQKEKVLEALGFEEKEVKRDIEITLRFNADLLSDDEEWPFLEGYVKGKTNYDVPLGRMFEKIINKTNDNDFSWRTLDAASSNSIYFTEKGYIGIVSARYAE